MSNTTRTATQAVHKNALLMLITRLHFYIGLFIAPFVFVAALTGTLYVLTPQIEDALYQDALTTTSNGESHSIANQIEAANTYVNNELRLFAVRPAPEPGTTTRVMYLDATTLSGARAVFVDPVTLNIQGNMPVYGTSGVLPLRMTIDLFHRQLLLGDFGRIYSELAASWLWITALGGLYLWLKGSKKNKSAIASRTAYLKTRKSHGHLGLALLIGLIFFSATGLTWSKWAGGNISTVRQYLGWYTPSVNLQLTDTEVSQDTVPLYDQVLQTARNAGLEAGKIEIKPPKTSNQAWLVREIDRSWPTQVDSVAINPNTMSVVSHAEFEQFPLIAKLIRWGVDLHMGVLFGVVNQVILAFFGVGLCLMIIWGYTMWWRRRPTSGATAKPMLEAWNKLTPMLKLTTAAIAILIGFCLPTMGISLIAFILIDAFRWRMS